MNRIIIAIILIICSVLLIIGFIIVDRTFNKLDHERETQIKNFERKRSDKEKAFETDEKLNQKK